MYVDVSQGFNFILCSINNVFAVSYFKKQKVANIQGNKTIS